MMKSKAFIFSLFVAASIVSTTSFAEHTPEHLLAEKYGCISCHSLTTQADAGGQTVLPVGPSFQEIAESFFSNESESRYQDLYRIVKHGSSPYRSKWKGKISGLAMPPNDDSITDLEINRLLVWILSDSVTDK